MLHKLFGKEKKPVKPSIIINITSDEPERPTGRHAYNIVDETHNQMWSAKSHVANQLSDARDYLYHISKP